MTVALLSHSTSCVNREHCEGEIIVTNNNMIHCRNGGQDNIREGRIVKVTGDGDGSI